MPKRIQMRRTKGWRKPAGAIYVGRPTMWGNPFTVKFSGSAEIAVLNFRNMLNKHDHAEIAATLRGHDLACWCPLDQPCHADALLELANATPATPPASPTEE